MSSKMIAFLFLALMALIAVSATTGAVAATLVTGRDVKDGSLTGADIHRGSIPKGDLAPSARPRKLPSGGMVLRYSDQSCPAGTTSEAFGFVAENDLSFAFGEPMVTVNTFLTADTFDENNLYLQNNPDGADWIQLRLCKLP